MDDVAGATCFGVSSLTFDDFAGLDAAGADAHSLTHAVHLRLHSLQVDIPTAAGGVMSVRDVIAELRASAAEITFSCHDYCSNLESQKTPRKLSLSDSRLNGGPWTG
jgi:hypothetical protein